MDFAKLKSKLPIIIVVLTMFIGMGVFMIHYADKRVKDNLLKEFALIESLCQSSAGCPSVPEGWEQRDCPNLEGLPGMKVCASPKSGRVYKTLIYKASPDEFIAWWSYVSDTYIQITGGKNKQMRIEEFAVKK